MCPKENEQDFTQFLLLLELPAEFLPASGCCPKGQLKPSDLLQAGEARLDFLLVSTFITSSSDI